MKSLELRQKFLHFFKSHGHTVVPSSSLIPAEDPTLLFANAGMNQFKDLFLGKEQRSYVRATSIQKCMRAGGKHNDLDNVGYTKRHLTFFEMMGNFSFGDYFKKEAIQFAWDFCTKEIKLDATKIYVTVFHEDQQSYDIWHKHIGVPAERISRLGAADNFWQMGDTGPCGPCSELYIDRGAEFGCGKKDCAPGCNCDRFLEFWNLVFMQFDRQQDGTDVPLKQTGVDTGMGLERLTAIVQDKDSVFETDLFMPIIEKTQELTGIVYSSQIGDMKAAFHVLADHVRAASFLIADGCSPSNEGRGYVLRKIIRRAALFAKKLTEKNIFPQLADVVIAQMSAIYPELQVNSDAIKKLLTSEIEKFSTNLVHGQQVLQEYFTESARKKIITGQQAFKLYDTFGFPRELTTVLAHERGYTVDNQGFEDEMEQQRHRSGKKMVAQEEKISLSGEVNSLFTGYTELETPTKISALIVDAQQVEKVPAGTTCLVVTQKSPFYVEKGGQVSDVGWLVLGAHKTDVIALERINGAIAHKIKAPVDLMLGESVVLKVDKQARLAIMKNHTATHLLQAALIQLFGKQIKQAGSLVAPDYLRFDFTYHENLTPEQIKQVEDIVNQRIWENIPVGTTVTTYKDAVGRGVIAFFGDKYNPEEVRVVEVTGFSAELCGGTHVRATGDIGSFKITEISALSAGQRRIVAVTGPKAVELFQESFGTVKQLAQEFKVQLHEVAAAVQKQKEQIKHAQQETRQLKKQLIDLHMPLWLAEAKKIGATPTLLLHFDNYAPDDVRDIAQKLVTHKDVGFVCITSSANDVLTYVIMVAPAYAQKISIKDLSAVLKSEVQFQGGGSGTVLQGRGPKIDPKKVSKAIEAWLSAIK